MKMSLTPLTKKSPWRLANLRGPMALLSLLGGVLIAGQAAAAPPTVITVPYAPNNLDLPHPVHERARITLKGIIRDAPCGTGYTISWDVNRNGNYDDDPSFNAFPRGTTNTVYDIGKIYEVPEVDRGKNLTLNVRVVSKCDVNDRAFGTYRLYVYDWTPSSDPTRWTSDQIEVMSSIAVREALWWQHRQMGNYGGTGSTIEGYAPHPRYGPGYRIANNISMMWAMSVNGHLPAFPLDENGDPVVNMYGREMPEGWAEQNAARWENDPYAETMLRGLNYTRWVLVDVPVSAVDEGTTCGLGEAGIEEFCPRIEGTTNELGLYFQHDYRQDVYLTGLSLGAIATLLPALRGIPVQTARFYPEAVGETWDWVVQEMVDFLGYAQHDSGCATGSHFYRPVIGDSTCSNGDSSAAQWAFIGLESAAVAGTPYGVIVNNRHKYRTAIHLLDNQAPNGSAKYRTQSTPIEWGDFQLTGGALIGMRWLGVHNIDPADPMIPFMGYADYLGMELKTSYDNYLAFTARNWERADNGFGGGEMMGTAGNMSRLFEDGDYLCGTPIGVYNVTPCGNSYALYSHQKAYRTGQPELLDVGGHDWVREFSTYYLRAQSRYLDNYADFGSINDRCENIPHASIVCRYSAGMMSTAWGSLVLTPTIFRPKPIAIAQALPSRVIEGCAGGGAGVVTLDHSDSFHPNRDAFIEFFQWDVDDSDGLWWETGAPPDYVSGDRQQGIQHTYLAAGSYNVTLRVVENDLGAGEPFDALSVTRVIVDRAPNAPPGVVAGGPYFLDDGDPLILDGQVSDPNQSCGDVLTVGWDFDNDGIFDDAAFASGLIPAIQLNGLPGGVEIPITIRVEDSTGLVDTDETTLTIFSAEPEAVARVNPQPAACRQPVRFDGSQSVHPNPQRDIVNYAWDVDGNPGVDGGGASPQFTYTYPSFGTFNGTLTVTDDRGRTDNVPFTVNVTEGNLPPVARTSQAIYNVAEGDPLVLDASGSSDPDGRCGDSIVLYEWDLDGDGTYGTPSDIAGVQPEVPWARLSQMNWPADRDTGLPTNTITLRVTDSLGATAEVEAGIRIFRARPIATWEQRPNPAPVRVDNGLIEATLDARDSYSPVPGVTIARYDWDLDDDGVFETQNRPVVNFSRVLFPLPDRGDEPELFVGLRVTDSVGRVNSPIYRAQVHISVPPTPPTVDPDPRDPGAEGGVGYHILVGEGITLDGSDSFDPDVGDRIVAFRWDLDGDGNFDVVRIEGDGRGDLAVTEVTPQRLAELGLDTIGEYTITLEVEDLQGLTNEGDAPLTVHPRDPEAHATANPNPTACGGQVTFDAANSTHSHPGINVVAWRWDFNGDGLYDEGEGESVNYRFQQFTFGPPLSVGLEVEDSRGHVGRTTVNMEITEGNSAPAANAGSQYAIPVGADLRLDGTASVEPNAACGDAIVSYRWDLNNDGTFDAIGATPLLTSAQLATFGMVGADTHIITLEVRDRFGRTATDEAVVWLVAPPTAVARASQAVAVCNERVEFDGGASTHDGPDGGLFEIVEYAWDMDGDGIFERNGADVFQPVVARDRLEARLRVTDGFDRVAYDTVTVNVNIANLRPTADAGGPYVTGLFNGNFVGVNLDGRASTDANAPCDAIQDYWWDTDGDGLYGSEDVDGAGSLVGTDYIGDVVRDYINPTWEVGTTQVVGLKARDAFGEWSEVVETEIRVRSKIPPTGEIITPRADDCVTEDLANVEFVLRQPGGGAVVVTAFIGDTQVGGPINLNLPQPGDDVQGTLPIDISGLDDGLSGLRLVVLDDEEEEHTIGSGGNVIFDREGPEVQLNALLVEGACYDANEIPDAQVNAIDDIDPAPQLQSEEVADACGRTMTVTAVDACGNETVVTRSYLVAELVDVTIAGAEENAVVSNARLNWDLIGPAQCSTGVVSTLSRNGGPAAPYAENTLIQAEGRYALNLAVSDCQGRDNNVVRNFTVNAPPVADPGGPYLGLEGEEITLNGGNSSAPEEEDFIASIEWDMDNDGVYELLGEVVSFTPMDNGMITGTMRVTDGQGATTTTNVDVLVNDISPVAVPGGPYETSQGLPVEFDATGSFSTNPQADPLTAVEWDFGDGETVSGGLELLQVSHRYLQQRNYNVLLTVSDEDNSTTVVVPVAIIDVGPVIAGVEAPVDAFEIREWPFEVEAFQGSPDDPILEYRWDWGDGSPIDSGPELIATSHAWRDAGTYTVTVQIRDIDSVVDHTFDVVVRPMTLLESMLYVQEVLEAVDQGPVINALLVDAVAWLNKGIWAEQNDLRGNTFESLSRVMGLMVGAQGVGADLGDSLWVLSRALLRSVEAMQSEILDPANGGAPLAADDHPSMLRAGDFIASSREIFDDPDFMPNVRGGLLAFQASDLFRATYEAYFYLRDAIDPCKAPEYNGFAMPDIEDLLDRAIESNPVNNQLGQAMSRLASEIQSYIDLGNSAPGRAQAIDALGQLRDIQRLLSNRIDIGECADAACLSDRDALSLLLNLMDLANSMVEAYNDGTYVRTWQACMIEAVKFRTELSEMRMQYVCGLNNPYVQEVSVARTAGMELVNDGNVIGALDYFRSRDIRCLAIRGYNKCLVPRYPAVNQEYERPEFCPDDDLDPENPNPGGSD
ncbi:MAG: PKD domain-containing protein [Bradymonadia bacterium]